MSSATPAPTATLSRGPRPQGPRRPQRLATLKNVTSATLRARSESLQPLRRRSQARCPECNSTDLSDLDGTTVCAECGVTVRDANIVAEVTFGESAAGAAIVQGGFVGEGQRHARTGQPGRYIHEAREPREISEANGREELRRQANWLHLSDHVFDQAMAIYKLALNYNFVQGRLIKVVASVCLYAACRRDPRNQTILMDFAEAITVNVFKLGQTWTDLKKSLFLEDLKHVPVIEVENLIMKFARKLEFGNSLMRVAEDAARLLKRMKRDWMVTGRRPAGLVGACIILAARMNNFRRTVREVVYIVKVADITLVKRLEEFNRTDSSKLTVDQFREHGLRLKRSHDPPVYHDREEREKKRQKRVHEASEAEENESQENNDTGANKQPSTRSKSRLDADGFAIPATPASSAPKTAPRGKKRAAEVDIEVPEQRPAKKSATQGPSASSTQEPTSRGKKRAAEEDVETTEQRPAKRPVGRPRKSERPAPLVLTDEDLLEESELEKEMENILNDPESIAVVEDAAVDEEAEARAKALAESFRDPSITETFPVPDDPEIGEHEFEDDPEVANCLLSEAERKIKERIWVTHNEDWLRARQEKWLRKAAEEASGATKKPKRKRTKGRMGDGSVLEGGSPIRNAADAARRMLEKHAVNPSKHINYQNVERLYAELIAPESTNGTDEGSRAGSTAPSETTQVSEQQDAADSTPAPPTLHSQDKKSAAPTPTIPNRNTTRQTQPNIVAQEKEPIRDRDSAANDTDRDESDFDPLEAPEEYYSDEDIDGTLEDLGFDNEC